MKQPHLRSMEDSYSRSIPTAIRELSKKDNYTASEPVQVVMVLRRLVEGFGGPLESFFDCNKLEVGILLYATTAKEL